MAVPKWWNTQPGTIPNLAPIGPCWHVFHPQWTSPIPPKPRNAHFYDYWKVWLSLSSNSQKGKKQILSLKWELSCIQTWNILRLVTSIWPSTFNAKSTGKVARRRAIFKQKWVDFGNKSVSRHPWTFPEGGPLGAVLNGKKKLCIPWGLPCSHQPLPRKLSPGKLAQTVFPGRTLTGSQVTTWWNTANWPLDGTKWRDDRSAKPENISKAPVGAPLNPLENQPDFFGSFPLTGFRGVRSEF